jgi:predicted DNA-binding antitoxin AbrB/MazE fold protein
MTEVISAVYENGLLYPLESLNLHEHQRVKIRIVPEATSENPENIIQLLTEIGLLTSPQGYSHISPLSDDERSRLSYTLAQATTKPLSEMIIEERDRC